MTSITTTTISHASSQAQTARSLPNALSPADSSLNLTKDSKHIAQISQALAQNNSKSLEAGHNRAIQTPPRAEGSLNERKDKEEEGDSSDSRSEEPQVKQKLSLKV